MTKIEAAKLIIKNGRCGFGLPVKPDCPWMNAEVVDSPRYLAGNRLQMMLDSARIRIKLWSGLGVTFPSMANQHLPTNPLTISR